MKEQKNSRLAEMLGVEEDELWKYGEKMFRFHGGFREVWEDDAWQIRTDEIELTKIINHPEDIVKVRLTEPELAICKSVGAKWVSRDDSPDDGWVSLWAEKPEKYKMVYLVEPGGNLARVLGEKFPSVEPGDCIGLRDMEDDVV